MRITSIAVTRIYAQTFSTVPNEEKCAASMSSVWSSRMPETKSLFVETTASPLIDCSRGSARFGSTVYFRRMSSQVAKEYDYLAVDHMRSGIHAHIDLQLPQCSPTLLDR